MKAISRRISYVFHGPRLYGRISWTGGLRYELSMNVTVERDKFDGRRCRANTTHGAGKVSAMHINSWLQDFEDEVDRVFFGFEQKDVVPTVAELRLALRKDAEPINLWKARDNYLSEMSVVRKWSANTLKTVRNTLNILSKFDSDLSFDTLTPEKIEEFVSWQYGHKLSGWVQRCGEKGYSNNVVAKNLRILKGFLRWCSERGYIRERVVSSIRPVIKTVNKPVLFLSYDELMKVADYPFEKGSELDQARDFFCFCCFSSLRYSDAAGLKKVSVSRGCINVVSQKTDKSLVIDLNSRSESILTKYKSMKSEYALPRITNNRLNNLLKKIGNQCEINSVIEITQYYGGRKVSKEYKKYELLSSHWGRRTFVCFALHAGIPAHIIMKWTGHSDFASMKPYMDAVDQDRREAMRRLDARLTIPKVES